LFKIGRVTHFYDKIGVAIVELDGPITVGEKVQFVRGGEDLFWQTIESIQVEHRKLNSAGRGETVGIITLEPVREGTEIFKSES
jgi:hypothetical protein